MKVVYHVRSGRRIPDYHCDGRTVDDPQPVCQWISGTDVDAAVNPNTVHLTILIRLETSLRRVRWRFLGRRL